ncbi:MAG TPA: tryptophan synthase subunit alpha, partial [Dehalococcoidia bacterium]|nr:tryptophan synthase subunit alpha [Dehalococcoidia bacterium]
MSRIAETFARLRARRRTGLVAFLTVGYPSVEDTLRLVPALIEGGADVVEL